MPNTKRTPSKAKNPQGAMGVDLDLHSDVVKIAKATDVFQNTSEDFESRFKQKNAHVKRTITRAQNLVRPFQANPLNPVHADDIVMLRTHILKVDAAFNALNEYLDLEAIDMQEEDVEPYVRESDLHIPSILDLRARVTSLEQSLQKPTVLAPPATTRSPKQSRAFKRIDTTFRPKPLDVSATPAMFAKWRREFQIYVRRNGFDDAPADEQRVLLNDCLTPEMEDALERICSPEDDDSLEDTIEALKQHLEDSNNLVAQRFAYFNCVQRPDESLSQYMIRFKKLGDYASFDEFTYDENMVLRLLTGTHDRALRKELMRLPKPDFKTVKKFTLAWESSHINSNLVEGTSRSASMSEATDVSVEKVSAYKLNRKSTFQSRVSKSSSSSASKDAKQPQEKDGQPCQYCGFSNHSGSGCPAKDKICSYCKKTGHFSKVCRKAKRDARNKSQSKTHPSRSVDDVQEIHPSDHDSSADVGTLGFHVYEIDTRIQAPTPRIQAHLLVQNRSLGMHYMLPDTGAAVSVMPSSLIHKWKLPPQQLPSNQSLRTADGTPIPCLGTVPLTLELNGYATEVVFFVCDGISNIILSWIALKNLAVIPRQFPQQNLEQLLSQVTSHDFSSYKSKCLRLYSSVFESNVKLSEMRGDPMRIHLRPNIDLSQVKPVVRPRPVPIPLKDAVRDQLQSMVRQGIIRKVTEPTDFVSPLVVVPKKNNNVRLVVDYTQLNKFVNRPNHPFPSVAEVRASIPAAAKWFATLDAVQGYLQIPLHPSAQPLTTFITPWGRYCYMRAPMGLSCSGDEFCARGDQAFQGISNIIKVVDDILVFAESKEGLIHSIDAVLAAAKQHGISLSSEKFVIGPRVDFVGLTISHDSIRPDDKHFEAIANFPEPANKTDLRSFLGMVNQFAPFSTDIAKLAKPLRPLLSKASNWYWDEIHRTSFQSLRQALVQSQSLHCFDPARPTKLLTDASRLNGLGYALMQDNGGKWVLISCGSRFVTQTEANYAVFELEALAIVWAIQKCRIFLLGLPNFDVLTDHRPLVTIFNSTRISNTDNPRILRLLQKVSMYTFQVSWVPGRRHNIPDALSRAPVGALVAEVEEDTPVAIRPDVSVRSMAEQSRGDPHYQDIVQAVRSMELKDVKRLPLSTHAHVRSLSSLWNRLSVDGGSGLVLLDAARILVPKSWRQTVVDRIHVAHQGITRTRARMQKMYFWPGMANQITQAVQACELCQKHRDEQPAQSLQAHQMPPRPFHSVSMDVFEYKRVFFLVYVDRFSGWPSVASFQRSPSSSQIIAALQSVFKDFGIPEVVRHDGATPFVSGEFSSFLKEHGIEDQLSSAYNPASNGHAEAAVKAMKLMVKKCWLSRSVDKAKFCEALLEWRNTPKYPGNMSPAEIIFGRRLRTKAPCISYDKLADPLIYKAVKDNFDYMDKTYAKINCRRVKPSLPQLNQGDQVRVRDHQTRTWDKTGVVVGPRDHGGSYFVDVQGKRLLRNRRLLRKKNNI